MDKNKKQFKSILNRYPIIEKDRNHLINLLNTQNNNDNNDNNSNVEQNNLIELTLEKLYPDDDNDKTYKIEDFLNKFDNVNIYTVIIHLDLSVFGINTTPYWKISYLDAGSTSYIGWIYLTIYNDEYEVQISDTIGSNPTISINPDEITVHPYIKGNFAISKLTDNATNVDCINKINELIDGLYNLKAVKRLISFTIDRSAWNGGIITCVAVEGMTWAEWQRSEYSEDAKESNGELRGLRLVSSNEEIPYRYLWRNSYQNDDGYGLCRTDEDSNPILLDADSNIDDGEVYVEQFTTNYEY